MGAHYECADCGHVADVWAPRCPACRSFKFISRPGHATVFAANQGAPHGAPRAAAATVATVSAPTHTSPPPAAFTIPPTAPRSEPIRITLAEAEIHERIATNIEPLDRVLGGGLVVGSVVLLGGEPGQGKSTLVAQALATCARRCLYVTGEESIGQATMRAKRIGATTDQIWIVNETDVGVIVDHARGIRPDVLVIDSIQTCADPDIAGVPGSINQIRACAGKLAAFAKAENIATILVCHVTKDGVYAGPKTLEHLVDATLFLDPNEFFAQHRVLRSIKNRFGSTQEIGSFVMGATGLAALEPEAEPEPDHSLRDAEHGAQRDAATGDHHGQHETLGASQDSSPQTAAQDEAVS